ncbi:AMP-binding protein [Hydrogenophaga sp. YM1]|uniref:AMP-binding protein n=1 Tax=Hydrogenophaga sp. YM1 TaxID=2806262 RepID=UPI001957E7F2|nr:AMP-binding protein [Hydrogenophaga sp. YM1]QRR33988.1 AMP-binding protein [Hydrogenophaga sp. YM1]
MDDLSNRAAASPQDIAAHDAQSGQCITYLHLHERSARLGAALVKDGLRPGDSVALLIDHSLLDHEIRWAARRVGLACVTVSAAETSRMQELLEHCEAKVLFAASKYRRQIEALPDGLTREIDVIYVDGTAAREIVDGYEWTVSYGEMDECFAVIAKAGRTSSEAA